jgi:hypothetical protein
MERVEESCRDAASPYLRASLHIEKCKLRNSPNAVLRHTNCHICLVHGTKSPLSSSICSHYYGSGASLFFVLSCPPPCITNPSWSGLGIWTIPTAVQRVQRVSPPEESRVIHGGAAGAMWICSRTETRTFDVIKRIDGRGVSKKRKKFRPHTDSNCEPPGSN